MPCTDDYAEENLAADIARVNALQAKVNDLTDKLCRVGKAVGFFQMDVLFDMDIVEWWIAHAESDAKAGRPWRKP